MAASADSSRAAPVDQATPATLPPADDVVVSLDAMPRPELATATELSQRALARAFWVPPLILTLAFGLRGLTRAAMWRDEAATWWAATIPLGDFFRLVGNVDAVLAPYDMVMRLWVAIAGTSLAALRLPSTLAMAGAAVVVSFLGRRLYQNPSVGLVAGLLFAVVPATSAYAQEARAYALVILAVLVATMLLVRALEGPSWRRFALYGLGLVGVGLFHLVALVIVAGHAVGVLAASGDRRRALQRWATVTGAAILVIVPIVVAGYQQRGQVSWLPAPTLSLLTATPAGVFRSTAAAMIVIGVLVAGLQLDYRTGLLVGCAGVAPILLFLLSYEVRLFEFRYVLFAVPFACLLAAATIARLDGRRWWTVAVNGTLVVLVLVVFTVNDQRALRAPLVKQGLDYTVMAAPIVARFQPGDGVAYADADTNYLIRLGAEYEFARAGIRPAEVFAAVPATDSGWWMPIGCTTVDACRTDAPRIWLVRIGAPSDPISGYAPPIATVLRADYTIVDVYLSPGATVVMLSHR